MPNGRRKQLLGGALIHPPPPRPRRRRAIRVFVARVKRYVVGRGTVPSRGRFRGWLRRERRIRRR